MQKPPPATEPGWGRLLDPVRLGRDGHPSAGRSEFHRDHDRIVFSSPFRRLGRKTQVHPLTRNDHVHTRLTHSIEAGSVGRSLGRRVGEALAAGLPQGATPGAVGDIVQAACLAHDIGNPPFGHAGEDAVRSWFLRRAEEDPGFFAEMEPVEAADLTLFEGNAIDRKSVV